MLFYIVGHLEVRVSGRRPERFLNLAVADGIYFWDVRWRGEAIVLCMGLRAFKRIRPIARKSRCRVRIIRKRGVPFLVRRAAGRRVLLGGVAALVLLLYTVSSYVWFVEVQGLKTVPRDRVINALSRLGLHTGAYKGGLDLEMIAHVLPSEVPELAWAGVYVKGTRAVVEVAERTLLPPEKRPVDAPADMVAAKDGLITQLIVLSGEGAARNGQTVRKGQVLIRGRVTSPAEARKTAAGDQTADGKDRVTTVSRPVRARGLVQARVWYDTYMEIPLKLEISARTGRSFTRRELYLAGWRLILSGWGEAPFADYQAEETLLRPREWRKTSMPVELIYIRYHEVMRRSTSITRAEATRRAHEEAKRKLLETIPPAARIIKESSSVVQAGPGFVGLRLVIEAEEDIGRIREIRDVPGGEVSRGF